MKKNNVMLEEIYSEIVFFKYCLKNKEDMTRDFTNLFRTHNIKRIYMSGSGSPSHIGLILKYAITKLLHIEVTYSYPMLFNNHEGFNIGEKYKPEEMLLICPAESGHSKGAVIAARKARALGIPIICTTLIPDGVLGRECTVVMKKPSGVERALPSTKGHSTGLYMFLLCIIEAAYALQTITEKTYQTYLNAMEKVIFSCESAIENTIKWFDENQSVVMNAQYYRVIGYGANYGTALEAALKFVETHRRITMAYELEEFLHGPIRTIKQDDVIFLICAEEGEEKERIFKLYEVLSKITKNCVLIGNKQACCNYQGSLTFEAVDTEFINTLEYIVPMQVLACKVAEHLGFDPTTGINTWAKLEMEPCYTD